MRRLIIAALILAVIGGITFWFLTAPREISAADLPKHQTNVQNGEYLFHAGGCVSCHTAPASEKCDDPRLKEPLKLAGGKCLKTPFGTFYAPNISSDPKSGIGAWTMAQFVTAMKYGVSPKGQHYYPAFPYTSYQRMKVTDLMDLKAYMDTLPAVSSKVPAHDLALPFRLRRGLGLWKLLYADGKTFVADKSKSDEINRGAYLVNGPAHCGECHSPRNLIGGIIQSKRFSGGPAPEGGGYIPNITPHETGIGAWSAEEIAYSLESGFTPSFDSFGGTMTEVQENMSKLTPADRNAIAAYLKSIPAIASKSKNNK